MSESLLIKLQACNSIKKGLQHSCFPANIEKIFKSSFSYRTALVAASGIENFFVCDICNLWKWLVWHKHNLMISSSVGSGHHDKYSYEISPQKLIYYEIIVTRNNIVWKLARDYCLCYCKIFLLVPDSTECTKIFVTKKCSTWFVSPKIK